MLQASLAKIGLPGALALVAILASCSQPALERPNVAPVVAGLLHTNLPEAIRGRVLLGELGCVACHAAGTTTIERRQGPNLRTVGERVQTDYLQRFLASPHAMEPGTTMPDTMRRLAPEAAMQAATELTHYLRSFAPIAPTRTAIDSEAATRGSALYQSIGCNSCHAATAASRQHLAQKYTVESLQQFLLAPHQARPAARMPTMALSPAEAFDLANHLLATPPAQAAKQTPAKPDAIDTQMVAAGRARFAELGCANCHELPDPARPTGETSKALKQLNAQMGCMSGEAGNWPHYALTPQQAADLRAALQAIDQPVEPEAQVQQVMAARNCFACHRRDQVDAVTHHENDFTTRDASLGQDGRLPPTLTGIGAKLQRDWLQNSIAHGQAERPYLNTRMPGFGQSCAQQLTELLTSTDTLPAYELTPLPENRKEAEVITKLGRDLVGDQGMNCITCHQFAGEQAGAMGAIDLVHSTGQRLRPEWFAGFLRDPYRFKPNTLMPQFFPDGKSTRPEFVGGDAKEQIDAMWHYLAEGRNVRKPRGINHPPIELVVKDEAVMLRRSVQNTGKRGISVGYPGGVNITFDAENLGLNQIWWGRFVDARPVWTGQGSGQVHILGKDRESLPNGPAFAAILPDQPWPTATRREHGDRLLGYDLDAQQRPTFRYTTGNLTVEDTPREQRIDGQTVLSRTLSLRGDREVLFMRVARHKQITAIDDHVYRIGSSLRIDVGDELAHVQPAGDEQELRILANVGSGECELHITYSWLAEGK